MTWWKENIETVTSSVLPILFILYNNMHTAEHDQSVITVVFVIGIIIVPWMNSRCQRCNNDRSRNEE